MRRHRDLVGLLRSNGMRITEGRRLLLQYILDNSARRITLAEIHAHLHEQSEMDRASVYRNLQTLKKLEVIQELKLPGVGKCFQYVLGRRMQHFYICKACGKATSGDRALFKRIEAALEEVRGFAKSRLSVAFYGTCPRCARYASGYSGL
jgi:Fe2+ or Zn2+ uptake regulation protein